MTITRPWRRMTLHLSQIGLTLGLTFTAALSSLVAVDDAAPGEVVGRELHDDPVLGEDADVVLAHLAADVGEDLVSVAQLDAEHRVRQSLEDGPLHLDDAFLLRHVLRNPSVWSRPCRLVPAAQRARAWPWWSVL